MKVMTSDYQWVEVCRCGICGEWMLPNQSHHCPKQRGVKKLVNDSPRSTKTEEKE
jgi:hypothetical protein